MACGKRLTQHPAGLHNSLQTGAHTNAKGKHAGTETESARNGSAVILRAGTRRAHECLASERMDLRSPVARTAGDCRKAGARSATADGAAGARHTKCASAGQA